MVKFLQKIIVAIISTTFFSLWYKNYTTLDNVLVFLITFFMIDTWSKVMEGFKPQRITKDIDESLHPVVEYETILHTCNIEKHYGKKYDQRCLEKCDCGSTLFRIYNEDTEKGTYIQLICVKCNQKATGLEFNWKADKNDNKN